MTAVQFPGISFREVNFDNSKTVAINTCHLGTCVTKKMTKDHHFFISGLKFNYNLSVENKSYHQIVKHPDYILPTLFAIREGTPDYKFFDIPNL